MNKIFTIQFISVLFIYHNIARTVASKLLANCLYCKVKIPENPNNQSAPYEQAQASMGRKNDYSECYLSIFSMLDF